MNSLKSAAACLILITGCMACSTSTQLVGNRSVLLSPGVQISHEAVLGAALAGVAIWYVADPLAPTWAIERRKLAEDRYRIDLRQKRFAVGGDGEAQQVFRRAAETLAEESGFSGYTIVTYTEGIESGPLISQRVSRGVILLTGAVTAAASNQ